VVNNIKVLPRRNITSLEGASCNDFHEEFRPSALKSIMRLRIGLRVGDWRLIVV